ncbi:MAG: ANTAR domain-containing protein [Clostridiaceae bacterium]|nr:ANTAR domain-containing protein [Clostridiaceae bacterium]
MDSVLIVSSGEKSVAGLLELLSSHTHFSEIVTATDSGMARRVFLERDFDLCVVNTPLPDEFGDRLARYIAHDGVCQVILLVRAELADDVAVKVEDDGVLTIPKPVNRTLFWNTLKLAAAVNAKLSRIKAENDRLLQKIEDNRLVDRAKCLLVQHLGMSEPDAHRYIEKQAMDSRVPRVRVAEDILKTYEG